MANWLRRRGLGWLIWQVGAFVLLVGIFVDYPVHRHPLRWVVLGLWAVSSMVSGSEALLKRRREKRGEWLPPLDPKPFF